jgi:hypothetical protein
MILDFTSLNTADGELTKRLAAVEKNVEKTMCVEKDVDDGEL